MEKGGVLLLIFWGRMTAVSSRSAVMCIAKACLTGGIPRRYLAWTPGNSYIEIVALLGLALYRPIAIEGEAA
jgi:enoyl-[acyl-carrier-protein] reductase (NADH)